MAIEEYDLHEFSDRVKRWLTSEEVLLALDDRFMGVRYFVARLIEDVHGCISEARLAASQPGARAVRLTAFRRGYYVVRGIFDDTFAGRVREGWQGERWYSLIDLSLPYPTAARIIGGGNTRDDLERDLPTAARESRGLLVGFGDNPFDTPAGRKGMAWNRSVSA